MAARRGKSQAKRNQDNGSLPGWAWGVIGLLLGVVLIMAAPKVLKSDNGDGFFRPQPNPDARPAPASVGEEETVAPDNPTAAAASHDKPAPAETPKKAMNYDFYDVLPGKEVPLTDAQLDAIERSEEARRAKQQKPSDAAQVANAPQTGAAATSLPKPVAETTSSAPAASSANASPAAAPSAAPRAGTATPGDTVATAPAPARSEAAMAPATASATPAAAAATTSDDNTRYLLQAGSFQASGQAEEMKAKIAMLGLGARVESAQIDGRTVYRVRMGPYGTAGDLAEAKRKLADGGLPGMAIKVKPQ